MNFNTVDLEEKLHELKNNQAKKDLLGEVKSILNGAKDHDQVILDNLSTPSNELPFDESKLDEKNIFTLEQIRQICVKYRLRFLDSSVFKGEIPYEAISKIKGLEKDLDQPLTNFKVVAPKELFKLEDKDSDPLLFLQLSNNRYYLIHKWGGELNVFRSLLAWPLQKFMNMFKFLLGVAVVFSLLVPTPSWDVFAFLVVHSFIAICGIACMLVFSLRENFSNTEWDSKFLS